MEKKKLGEKQFHTGVRTLGRMSFIGEHCNCLLKSYRTFKMSAVRNMWRNFDNNQWRDDTIILIVEINLSWHS